MLWVSKILVISVVLLIALPSYGVEKMYKNGKAGVWMSEEEFDAWLIEHNKMRENEGEMPEKKEEFDLIKLEKL